jgi:hypothetical protein
MNVLKGAEQRKTFERETPMGRMAMVDEAVGPVNGQFPDVPQ